MKKYVSAICLLAAMFCASGCEKYVTEQYITEVNGAQIETYYVVAEVNKWSCEGEEGKEGCYMYQTFEFPEISEKVIDKGAVIVYFLGTDGRDVQLPYLLPYNEIDGAVYENIYYDCEPGFLSILIESSDFRFVPRNQDMEFKIVIIKP